MEIKLYNNDCIKQLRELPENSVDSIVTDPPYGLGKQPNMEEVLNSWLINGEYKTNGGGFMGKEWDSFVPSPNVWKECLRVLKPGGYMLVFFGTRTYDYGVLAIRLAGFEIKDMINWTYGSGFPKSINVGKVIDKMFGTKYPKNVVISNNRFMKGGNYTRNTIDIQNEIAKQYDGLGTALKPAHEPIVVARKPLSEKTIAENVLKYGTGCFNIDDCRIPTNEDVNTDKNNDGKQEDTTYLGRFPANFIHDNSDEVKECFPETKSPKTYIRKTSGHSTGNSYANNIGEEAGTESLNYGDSGSAARFFKSCEYTEEDYKSILYYAKANQKERDEGLEEFEIKPLAFSNQAKAELKRGNTEYDGGGAKGHGNKIRQVRNVHPTIKPISLMEYLCKLITPKNGTILDPFMGSGSTCIAAIKNGFNFIGVELEKEYFEIAQARIQYHNNKLTEYNQINFEE